MRRGLEPYLLGRRILEVKLHAPAGPKYLNLERAAGQQILGLERRGKFLLLPLSAGDELIIHLGMTGRLSAEPFARHTRVELRLSARGAEDAALHFQDVRRFGRFLLVAEGDYSKLPTLAQMGPEPLAKPFDEGGFYARLQKSSAPIKPYLLSQRPVAGVGNIYADEALWAACIHPLTPAKHLSKQKAQALATAIREVLHASLAAQGTTLRDYRTVNGEVGGFAAALQVYSHAGEPCARCGTLLKRILIAGRGTVFCPRCQKKA